MFYPYFFCKILQNLDWSEIRAWCTFSFASLSAIFLIKNYLIDKKKRRLAMMPFFTFREIVYNNMDFLPQYPVNQITLENIGQTAIVKWTSENGGEIKDKAKNKIGFKNGSVIQIKFKRTFYTKDEQTFMVPSYNFVIAFTDIEGNCYLQYFRSNNEGESTETEPLLVNNLKIKQTKNN